MTWTLAFNTLIIQSNTRIKLNRGEVKCKRMMFFFSCRAWLPTERERQTNREA